METTGTHTSMPVITVRYSRGFPLQYTTCATKYEEHGGHLLRRLEVLAATLYWPSTNSPAQVTSYLCYILTLLIFKPPAVATKTSDRL
jgi:hypothetical protein